MRYMSDDGRIFDTEQKCLEYENQEKKRLKEHQERCEQVKKHYKELLEEINSYNKDYESNIISDLEMIPLSSVIAQLFI